MAKIIRPRDSVLKFSLAMEKKLRRNDYKGGWMDCDPWWLLDRVKDEIDEIESAMLKGLKPNRVTSECADVANLAMMVAEVYGEE